MATLNDGSPESEQRGMTRYCDHLEARVAELEGAARRAVQIIDAHLYHQREKVEDASAILKAALTAVQ